MKILWEVGLTPLVKEGLRSSNVTYEDKTLQHTCQQKQDGASLEIQKDATSWLGIKVKWIKNTFTHQSKNVSSATRERKEILICYKTRDEKTY